MACISSLQAILQQRGKVELRGMQLAAKLLLLQFCISEQLCIRRKSIHLCMALTNAQDAAIRRTRQVKTRLVGTLAFGKPVIYNSMHVVSVTLHSLMLLRKICMNFPDG